MAYKPHDAPAGIQNLMGGELLVPSDGVRCSTGVVVAEVALVRLRGELSVIALLAKVRWVSDVGGDVGGDGGICDECGLN